MRSKAEPLAYSRIEAAEALQISDATLDRLISSGEIETFTIGRSRRISREALQGFIARRQAEAGVKVGAA